MPWTGQEGELLDPPEADVSITCHSVFPKPWGGLNRQNQLNQGIHY